MGKSAEVIVEFFGVPRQRAGRPELAVQACTVAEVLLAVARLCPGLAELVQPNGRLAPHYLLSINGREFVGDVQRSLSQGERILLLSADAGG